MNSKEARLAKENAARSSTESWLGSMSLDSTRATSASNAASAASISADTAWASLPVLNVFVHCRDESSDLRLQGLYVRLLTTRRLGHARIVDLCHS